MAKVLHRGGRENTLNLFSKQLVTVERFQGYLDVGRECSIPKLNTNISLKILEHMGAKEDRSYNS